MVGLRPDRELSGGVFGPGARLASRTGPTGRCLKADAHDGITRDIPPRGPFHTRMPLRTARLFGLPIQHEGAEVITLTCPTLVAIGPKGWPDHID
jgi:hypothetical protein